jgi:hypothetical protein
MSREKVEYSPNLPTIIELDGPGTQQASQSGAEEWRYFLRDERITWVPPAVHQQIVATGADYPGGTYRVTKHQAKARAPITWEVERVDQPTTAGYSNAASPTTETHYDERTPQGWTRREGPRPTPQPQSAPRSQAPPPAAPQRQPQPAAQLADTAPELPITAADRMAQALKDAIDLWRGASNYAPELHYDAGDVRALAATLFIDGHKGARQ